MTLLPGPDIAHRRLHTQHLSGPPLQTPQDVVRLLGAVTPRGFAPDWCVWSTDDTAFGFDPEKGAVGSLLTDTREGE